MQTRTRIALLALLAVMFAGSAALVLTSPAPYRVGLSSVMQIWGDLTRDFDAATKTLSRVSTEKEIEVGNEIDDGLWVFDAEDPALQAYVDAVGQRIAANVRRSDIPYSFRVVKSGEINAFAVPGGHVYITTAMIGMLRNEAELAAILGHEIAHVDLRHCIERLQIEIAMRSAGLGDLALVIGIAENLIQVGFSETMEREADRFGMLLAAEAGYSPLPALDVFRRMYFQFDADIEEAEQTRGPEGELARALGEALDEYFATHPPALARLDALRTLLENNARGWEGQRFVIGSAAYADRRPAGDGAAEGESWTFSRGSFDYLAMRAEIAGLLGREAEARRFFDDLEAAYPDDPRLRDVEDRMTARTPPDNQRSEATPDPAQNPAPDEKPRDARTAYGEGRDLERAGDYEGALEALREAVRLDPNFARAHAHLGEVAHHLEDHPLALASFSEAVRLDPDYDWAWAHMGRAAFASGDFALTISSLEQAVRLDPDYEWAHSQLGSKAMSLGLYELAIEHLETAIRLDDAGGDFERNNLAWIYVSSELPEFRDAERALNLARRAAQSADSPAAFDTLAAAHVRLGYENSALGAYRRAIELSADYAAGLADDLVFIGCANAVPDDVSAETLRPALVECIRAGTPPHVLAHGLARIDRARAYDPALALRLLAGLEQDYPAHAAVQALREQSEAW